jgi:hypothetical protein
LRLIYKDEHTVAGGIVGRTDPGAIERKRLAVDRDKRGSVGIDLKTVECESGRIWRIDIADLQQANILSRAFRSDENAVLSGGSGGGVGRRWSFRDDASGGVERIHSDAFAANSEKEISGGIDDGGITWILEGDGGVGNHGEDAGGAVAQQRNEPGGIAAGVVGGGKKIRLRGLRGDAWHEEKSGEKKRGKEKGNGDAQQGRERAHKNFPLLNGTGSAKFGKEEGS